MKIFPCLIIPWFFLVSFHAHTQHEIADERVYVRLSSMFSGEVAIGYEHRFNHLLGLSAGVQGGFHFFDTFGNGLNHIGPELGLFFYTHDVDSSHQFYLGPAFSSMYGHLVGHSEVMGRYSSTPHVLIQRLFLLSGYRYSFSIPLSLDIGLGMDVVSMVIPLNSKPSFLFFWPLPFINLGISYRF